MKVSAIIPAAGQGKRLGSKVPKAFVPVNGRPLLVRTLSALKRSFLFEEMIVAVSFEWLEVAKKILKKHGLNRVRAVLGGRTRAGSVRNALSAVSEKCDWVLVHDAARPLVSKAVVRRTILGSKRTGAAICALPVSATVKRIDRFKRRILRTEDRDSLFLAQTPQVFRKDLLLKRYRELGERALEATDEAALFDGSRIQVAVVDGEERNRKITTPEDMELFKFYLRKK